MSDVRAMMKSGDWDGARPAEFVELYAILHEKLHKFAPAMKRRDVERAVRQTLALLGDDSNELARFMKWAFTREEQHPRSEPVGWRLFFSPDFVNDYRIALHRNGEELPAIVEHAESEQVQVNRCTDLANAKRLVAQYGDRLRHARGLGWLIWGGPRWTCDRTGAVRRCAKGLSPVILAEAATASSDEERARLRKWSAESESRSKIEATIALAESEPEIAVDASAFDRDPWLLNVANGTIQLRTGKLREHRREDLITKVSPVVFEPLAKCPTWLRFLNKIFAGDGDLIGYVQRVCGYLLTGSIREHALFFLFGDGANGKSTLLTAIRRALGDYAVTAPRNMLMSKRGEAHPTELTVLHGARAALCPEVEAGASFDESLVKDLTGGEAISARRMREDFWSFEPTHKLVVSGNHKPTVRGADEGIWRRLRLIPFNVTIPPEERDKQLVEKLEAELPGILAWAVAGCLAWQREGLGEPPAVVEATNAYREEQDVIGDFAAECLVFDPGAKCSRRELVDAYEAWAKSTRLRATLSPRSLFDRLRRRGVAETAAKGARGFKGVRVRSDHFDDFAPGGAGAEGVQGSGIHPRDPSIEAESESAAPKVHLHPRRKRVNGGAVLPFPNGGGSRDA